MPIEKQSLNNFLPDGFETLNQEGYKENFNEDKIKTGYEKDVPDIVSGPNLNNLIDVVGKNTNTLNNYVEYLNGMPINNVPTTDENGQLNYINLDDKLTKKQITNCILELPQRIKYTLEEEILTVKAGSIFIIPYGLEDKTNELNIGDTFLLDIYKIYDMQFDEGKFFVWVELTQDTSMVMATSMKGGKYIVSCGQSNWAQLSLLDYYSTNIHTSETQPTVTGKNHYWYDLINNVVKTSGNTGSNWVVTNNTLPFLIVEARKGKVKAVTQVFNGVGYIDTVIWVDKDVKGLIPNGRYPDGTLNNIEYKNEKFTFRNVPYAGNRVVLLTPFRKTDYKISVLSDGTILSSYDENNNYFIDITFGGVLQGFAVASFYVEDTENATITNFNHKQPVSLATKDDIDGNWVGKYLQVTIDDTFKPGQLKTYDLSNYLPQDNNIYEVLIDGRVQTTANAGDTAHLDCKTTLMPYYCAIIGVSTPAARFAIGQGSSIIPIGADRQLVIRNSSAQDNATFRIRLHGYRRIR